MSLEPSRDVGLQHVLRGGLALMRGNSAGAGESARIVQALVEIFSGADRASDRLGLRLSVNGDEQGDLERFSIFFRYLEDEYGQQLTKRLSETTNVLRRLGDGAHIDPADRERAENFLAALLDAIRRDRALQPLQAPYVVTYG